VAGESSTGRATVRLYLNVGRKESVRTSEIVVLLREAAGVARKDVGRVQVRDSHTYVNVPVEASEHVIQSLRGHSFKGRTLIVERARR
jgi:ATP-dependent RNA helicase DeaD